MARVVVGVTGGIAAYKSASLIRLISERGHNVQVVATANALKFIGQATLEALSKNTVDVVDPDLFTDVDQVKHISIAKQADLIVVAPATASFLAKIAAGIADDLLTTTVLAASCPVILAPAMHTEMWESTATKNNLSTLKSRSFLVAEPGIGRLTGEDSGVGRLAEPEEIFKMCEDLLGPKPLAGLKVCVTAGGTREPIDAARFVGNYSSGKQGLAFAEAARSMGATVHLIGANLSENAWDSSAYDSVSTAAELGKALHAKVNWFDVLVMAAAVADYSPISPTDTKLKRSEIGDTLEIELKANPDLLQQTVAELAGIGRTAITIGFAAEASSDLETLGRAKLDSKGCDYIVANDVSGGAVFGEDDTSVLLVSASGSSSIKGNKLAVARAVLTDVATKLGRI